MQTLSDRLVAALEKWGGKLYMRHTVEQIHTEGKKIKGVTVSNLKGESQYQAADEVVANVTVQDLVELVDSSAINRYGKRIEKLPQSSGAFVIYLGVDQEAIPDSCPPHLQFLYDYNGVIGENNSLFVSVSKPGDGRAPQGKATIVASSFTDVDIWWNSQTEYEQLKQQYTDEAIARLGKYFQLTPQTLIHVEAATPRTFAQFTARKGGIVGGIGQRLSTFGPFGVATRTPVDSLWLVGDSTHPGEGTAGVSYSALTVVRQIQQKSKAR
jgi:C-3',4' desaturase CrtD